MNIGRYAPSAQFTVIALSLLLSGGLVYAAEAVTHPQATPASVVAQDSPAQPSDADNWEAALYAIQAANASSSLVAPSASSVNQLLQAAQSPNLTETVGKTLFINLSNAKSQGMGDDIPTQEQILAASQAQIKSQAVATLYTMQDLTIVPTTPASEHTFGNAVMEVFTAHPAASQGDTFVAIGAAVDNSDASQLDKLSHIKAAYAAVTADLLALPVPQTLAPLYLLVINDMVHVTGSYDDMAVMLNDPLRGIAGFQTYQSSLTEAGRLFTNIAQDLAKDGILFTKGEPGSAWSAYLSPQ